MDYILFLTADVSVTPNLNEIRDYKYVDKAELQRMFDDTCESMVWFVDISSLSSVFPLSELFHSVVQADCS